MIFKKFKYFAVFVLGIIFLLSGIINAANNNKAKRKMAKVYDGQVANQRMDINNLNALESNTGYSDYNLNSNLEGTEFPKGSGKNVVFEGGFLWGGFANWDTSQVRVGGSAYITGLEPGPILQNGMPADPTDSKWSIYRVRPDIYPGGPTVDLTSDVAAYAEGGQTVTAAELRAQYESDWTNWPAHGTANDLGAPFTDVNGDGIYEPGIDIPGVPGADQTCYFVANDLDTLQCQGLYGALPLGIELHVTYWAYAQQGALGDMYFKKWDLINKGYQKNVVDSMFVSYWTDVDLGSATDDLVGCDTTLSLQYTYNGEATDAVFAPLPPPADGFAFFQGPIVPGNASDSAISIGWPFKFHYTYGKKNRPMTAAYFFINGDANFGDPPQGQPTGSTQFYHFFNGEYGLSGIEFTDPNGNKTPFAFPGDPVTGTGWVDGVQNPPADRRQGMASGPFTFSPGDTQQVVIAEMFAGAIPSVNYLQAITLVKVYDRTAQSAYNHFFQLPSAPPVPKVTAVASNRKVVLDWGEDLNAVNATENSVIADQIDGGNYTFEGYNVYQFPYQGASSSQAKIIATYDVVDGITSIPYTDPVTRLVEPSISIQNGTDSGIKRSITITADAFNSNQPLNNGTTYYFAVTAYSYNSIGVPQSLENPAATLSVVPQSPAPGTRYTYNVGDTIIAAHSAGLSQGNVYALVLNPALLTGDQYKVTFDTTGGITTWSLTDVTKSQVILSRQTDQSGDNSYQTVSGMLVKVTGPPVAGMNSGGQGVGWDIPKGTRRFTWGTTSLLTGYGLEGFNGAIGWASPDYLYNGDPESVPASSLCNTLLTLAQVTDTSLYNPAFPPTSDVNLSFGYRYLRHASVAAVDPRFAPYIIHTTGGTYPFQDFAQSVPLSAWNVDNAAHPVRLALGYLENNAVGGLVDGKYWPPDYTQLDQASTREFLWIFQAPYSTTANSSYEEDALSSTSPLPVMWFSIVSRRGPAPFSPSGTGADQFIIYANHINTINDQFTFTAIAPTSSTTLAKQDVNSINVFPNPYYGVNSQETSKYARFVTFSHLPATATIRIFNLAGIQVKVINHTDGTQFQQWDLTNNSGLPVASGLYIVYIDMPAIGATKILKAAIIQEQQFPDHF
jgi:hypothetical protein